MREFTWDGRCYRFDANLCYATSGLIRLYDGTILSVGMWLETLPPIPTDLRQQSYLPGMEPDGIVPAELISSYPGHEQER